MDGENSRICKVNSEGIITTIAGNGNAAFSGDGGPATAAEVTPESIAIDTFGNIYISESDNSIPSHRIRKINTSGIISTVAGIGEAGYNGDNMQATAAKLNFPYLGFVDNSGNIYFSDYDNRRVRKISTSGIISTVAGNGTSGYSGDGNLATDAELKGPSYIKQSPSGDIYIPDNGCSVIRKVDHSTGIITTFAGTGTTGNTGDGGAATVATLNAPNSITFDEQGNAYIASTGANTIRKVNPSGIISTVAGTGVAGFNGDGVPATATQFSWINFVYFHTDGNLYISDINNQRIRRITFNPTAITFISIPPSITLYPNPAKTTLTLTTPQALPAATITICNVLGEPVINQTYTNLSQTDIPVSALPAGLYFVKVNGVYAGRFVKE